MVLKMTAAAPFKEGDLTLCGACLGTKIPPAPCKCGGHEVKIYMDSPWSVGMRCRKCGEVIQVMGSDVDAYLEWQKAHGVEPGKGLPASWAKLVDLIEETSKSANDAFDADVAVYRTLHKDEP